MKVVRAVVHPISLLLILEAFWGLFLFVLHPRFMNWGATPQEQAMVLPGDTAPPGTYFTRAISIDAPASAVWPWLQAIGQDRAGFLSYDYLENLTGADIHNADTLRPEWRQRSVGDRVPMSSPLFRRLMGDGTTTLIRTVEPERVIADAPGRFVLLPRAPSGTRLLLRESLNIPERSGAFWIIWDPMHFVMEQRLLQGVKERAEGRPFVPPAVQALAHVGWALAGVSLLGLFLSRRRWWPWLVLPIALIAPSLWLTGDLNSALAGFLAVGITVAGFLAFGWRWLGPYVLIATAVAFVLLLAPDSYATFGLILLVVVTAFAFASRKQLFSVSAPRKLHRGQLAWPFF